MHTPTWARKNHSSGKQIALIVKQFGDAYPELKSQEKLITKVVAEEESSFLHTLSSARQLGEQLAQKAIAENKNMISGKSAFELYDTYGFPSRSD